MTALKVMVLSGGPDRERAISLQSGAAVAQALRDTGHETLVRDIGPEQLSALDDWRRWQGDVVFPVLHGPWGEGGPLQEILNEHHVPFVGSQASAARQCMDKFRTKQVLIQHGMMTPPCERVGTDRKPTLDPPLVIKPRREGSSIDLSICHDAEQVRQAYQRLRPGRSMLAETFIAGKELTVGVIARGDGPGEKSLPPIWIVPNGGCFDYQAKYESNDTRYVVDPCQIELPASLITRLGDLAVEAHRALGCRHMSRVDFIVDHHGQAWILEINTIPGFTDHSLLPKAAAHAGLPLPALVDRLVKVAVRDTGANR